MDAQVNQNSLAVSSSKTLQIGLGSAEPVGATVTSRGVNFSLFCPDARAVILCLFHADTEEVQTEIVVPAKTGSVWHVEVFGLQAGQCYGYRVDRGEIGLHVDSTQKLLIDPYAKRLSRAIHWDRRQYQGDSQFMLPKSIVVDLNDYPPPAPLSTPINDQHRVIYEAHVKGLTQLHPSVPKQERGTYRGAAHPAVLAHLRALNVTTVQFMPLASFMPEPYITEKGLTNYWGYNPVNFFAPENRYAQHDALAEVQYMVSCYHAAGIEVIVDVVFNHTAEGGKGGPVLSFKGVAPLQSYLREQSADGALDYSNHSGCGNTVYAAHPVMTRLIMDAMRFWVGVIGVDGFRFDLAPCLGRDPQAFNRHAGLLRAIQQDPELRTKLLVAEPWDIGPGGYQVGQFPPGWLEVNDKYRDTVRAFWRGDTGLTADFATRFMGSRDLFHKGRRPYYTSVNNVTYHDGFCLQDLVSYERRHNLANKEDNRDGHGHNLSANYGEEGETTNPRVLCLRERQKRNLFTTLVLSQGSVHLLGGDELSRTQLGNNNAYCQDNEINWLHWALDKRQQDFLEFCQYVLKLKHESVLLSALLLEDDDYHRAVNVASIHWYKPDGTNKASADWQNAHNQSFAVELRGLPTSAHESEHWLICFNASDDDVRFHIPVLSPRGGWTLMLDTRYASLAQQPKICMQRVFLQAGKSIAVFRYSEYSLQQD